MTTAAPSTLSLADGGGDDVAFSATAEGPGILERVRGFFRDFFSTPEISVTVLESEPRKTSLLIMKPESVSEVTLRGPISITEAEALNRALLQGNAFRTFLTGVLGDLAFQKAGPLVGAVLGVAAEGANTVYGYQLGATTPVVRPGDIVISTVQVELGLRALVLDQALGPVFRNPLSFGLIEPEFPTAFSAIAGGPTEAGVGFFGPAR